MLFSTPSQFVVLGLLFFTGLIFAFVIHPGGRKWKKLYQEEVEENASYRNDADNEIRAAKRRVADLEREVAELQAQQVAPAPAVEPVVAEPEPVIAPSLVAVAPVTAEPVVETVPAAAVEPEPFTTPAATAEPEPVIAPVVEAEPEPVIAPVVEAAPIAEPVEPAPAVPEVAAEPLPPAPDKAWLGAAGYNDLTQIRGIDGGLNNRLFGLGVTRFADIEKLSAQDEMALEQRLNVPAGFIAREQWREQAALLRAGNFAEHSARFGSVGAIA
ncbi:MAG: hypothetical protein ABI471_06305 [Sphingomonas bacterium]